MRLSLRDRVRGYFTNLRGVRVKDWRQSLSRNSSALLTAAWRSLRLPLKRYETKLLSELVEHHLRLDEEIDKRLREVIDDTETAAMNLMIQVRQLAESSSAAAGRIEHGLQMAQRSNEDSQKRFIAQFARPAQDAETVAESMRRMQQDYVDMSQYYKTLFTVLTDHNNVLASGIADVLGQFQFQDVVRQRIERIEFAVGKRNEVLRALPFSLGDTEDGPARLTGELRMVLENYLAEEACHASSAAEAADDKAGLPKIELF